MRAFLLLLCGVGKYVKRSLDALSHTLFVSDVDLKIL